MTIMRTYQCPGTDAYPAHQFTHLHHPNPEACPAPRYCPECGFDSMGEAYQPALTMPAIGGIKAKSIDGYYKATEEGAEFRANIAMEKFGLDTEQANMLKVTNMRDNMREGDTSDLPVNNPVSQVMDAAPSNTFGFQGQAGIGYSSTVSEGPAPNMGARTQNMVRASHAEFTRSAGHIGATTSSMPALETTNPNYRKRVA